MVDLELAAESGGIITGVKIMVGRFEILAMEGPKILVRASKLNHKPIIAESFRLGWRLSSLFAIGFFGGLGVFGGAGFAAGGFGGGSINDFIFGVYDRLCRLSGGLRVGRVLDVNLRNGDWVALGSETGVTLSKDNDTFDEAPNAVAE